jgi:hypothetical protein
VSTATGEGTPTVTWQWVGRVVACVILVLGSLVFVTFLETSSLVWLALSLLGVVGALIYIFGLERPARPTATWARRGGWLMMVAFSLTPTSLLFGPLMLVLLALPTVLPRAVRS